ncbi:hypothetical protein [uncultured Shimia sp.]|uniref:hypothetical protein n=1 Tax=uncultured Shimia sp. TaxID=573152 RepID=UPI00261A82D2|nr:hypothetical protein [uncultured Shimia sp.]
MSNFVPKFNVLDGRKHLVAHYASETSTLTINIVDADLTDCLKANDEMMSNHIWTNLTHIGSFEADEEAASMITDFLHAYEEEFYTCEFSEDFEHLTFCYDGVRRSIARKVSSRVKFEEWSEIGSVLANVIEDNHKFYESAGCTSFRHEDITVH